MLTKAKLRGLKKQWQGNMADAEVGPLLEHIAELDKRCERAEILNGYLAAELAWERKTDPVDELDAARAALRGGEEG